MNNIFGNSDTSESPNGKINWIDLTTIAQLEEVAALSFEQPVVVFKHSTRCGISRMVLKRFESDYGLGNELRTYFLDLLAYREVSAAISEKFNVLHQSPQLLVIKDGKCIYDVSHDSIDANLLKRYL